VCFRVFREYYNILSNRFFPRFCIIPLQPSRQRTILYLSVITILIFAIPIQAQWSEDGILIQANWNVWLFDIVADLEGGAWVAWEELTGGGADAITRVQRFDIDGYPYFDGLGITVIHDSLGLSGFFMGAMPTEEGGVMVVFQNQRLDPDSLDIIRVQKFSTDGDRLFGPSGRSITNRRTNHFRNYGMIPSAISDGEGGVWACYNEFLSDEIHVCGMNADGSLKIDGDLNIFAPANSNPASDMCNDGEGGLYIAYYHTHRPRTYRIGYKHVLANGELEFEGSRIAIESEGGFSRKLYLLPISSGGFYLASMFGGAKCYLQRVNADGSWPWSIRGRLGQTQITLLSAYISRPVLMADTSVAIVIAGNSSRGSHLIRLQPNGDNYFENYSIQLVGNSPTHSSPPPICLATIDSNNIYAFHSWRRRSQGFPGPIEKDTRAYLINSEGEDIWGQDTVLIPGPDPDEFISANKNRATLSTEDDVIFGSRWSNIYTGTAELRLFKLTPDGNISGTEDITRETTPANPSELSITGTYPNPFNSGVKISFMVDHPGFISFVFYDLTGREVAHFNQNTSSGSQSITWHPDNTLGSGVYVVKLVQRGKTSNSRKIVYLK